jgi:DNA invertase Pin-like site-specific DNA recombinase
MASVYKRAGPAAHRVFGYCRVSTDRQADSGISLDEQERKIAARCSENGWHLEHVYVDAGVSGSTPLARRPQGGKLLTALRPGDVVIAAKMDRCFRSAFDALATIESFKRRKISLWLLDLGGDVSGNGISELIVTVLAAVAQLERSLISERIKDAKHNLRRANKHQGGTRPFGWGFGQANGHGRARELIPDEAEQAAIKQIFAMRTGGASLMAIRDAVRARGHQISHQSVANILARGEAAPAPSATTNASSTPWRPPPRAKDVISEGSGETLTIIGTPRGEPA